ncbi:MAG: ATP synthase F1 subunit delta [Sedimentisphaerales bacterium]
MIASDMNYCVGEVYSSVLFELAVERQAVEDVKSDLDELERFMLLEGSFMMVMTSPYFSIEQKSQLIETLFGGKFNELTFGFLQAAVAHNRTGALYHAIKKYIRLYKAKNGHREIWMTVAQALSPSEVESVKAEMTAALKTDKITLEFNVEPAIIGGTIIRYAGKMIDNTVRNRLHSLVDTIIARGRNSGKSI